MVLGVICQRPHSKIPDDSLSVVKGLGMCHLRKITKQLKFHYNSYNSGTFYKCCVSIVVTRSIAEMMYDPRFTEIHSSSIEIRPPCFWKEFSLVIFLKWHIRKHFKIVREPWTVLERVFENLLQKPLWNDVCPQVHRHTIFPKRNATFQNLRFFWRRV